MKLSARNVFTGTVKKVIRGAVNSEVQLRTAGGDQIVSIITNASVDALGLKEGAAAFAIIKASWVILGKDLHNAKLSTRNILCGTVNKVTLGAVNSEIALKLSGGSTLTPIITNESTQSLGLKQGDHACAAIKASSVILGVE
ncbi:MAG TPA: TOBE domain-containing protein [Dongiaceae bacterium]|nr:TOBE domain-containing protein [Dongiaceae bacterium]